MIMIVVEGESPKVVLLGKNESYPQHNFLDLCHFHQEQLYSELLLLLYYRQHAAPHRFPPNIVDVHCGGPIEFSPPYLWCC